MEYQELSHEDSKLVYLWMKPAVKEKLSALADYCRMTKGQLIEHILEGIEDEYLKKVKV